MIILYILIILISITFHEYAHGLTAYKLGDPTPKHSGRLSLNPLAHIDPFGTLILPVLLIFLSTKLGYPFSFGYAKTIYINPYHFKNPKKDIKWVGLAGPLANFILATLLGIIWKINKIPLLSELLATGVFWNLILATFNLIPIPPLDGAKIMASFLPNKISQTYLKMEVYGFIIIFILIITGFFKGLVNLLHSCLSNFAAI